jgi:hypothetical protein
MAAGILSGCAQNGDFFTPDRDLQQYYPRLIIGSRDGDFGGIYFNLNAT